MCSPKHHLLPNVLAVLMVLLMACNPKENEVQQKSNTSEDSCLFAPLKDGKLLVLDAKKVKAFIKRHPENRYWKINLLNFYKKRYFAYAWMDAKGLDSSAQKLIDLLQAEHLPAFSDAHHSQKELQKLYDYATSGVCAFKHSDSLFVELELLLSANFYEYAHRNWKGISESKSTELGWLIERKKLDYETLLDSIVNNPSAFDEGREPVFRQYLLLKKQLAQYQNIANKGGWPLVSSNLVHLKMGDTSDLIVPLKKMLFITGDLKIRDASPEYNLTLGGAIQVFQARNGLQADSILGAKTIETLQITVQDRIDQIKINMERSKWITKDFKGDYIMVNIPDYQLTIFNHDSLEWTCKVILGKESNSTVIFNDYLKYIVFSPYWGIPRGILKHEIIPAIKSNPDYFAQHNMELMEKNLVIDPTKIDWDDYDTNYFPFSVREKPGPENSLGLVKFIFPNSHNIYLHDTPAKTLFESTTRSFSHGCIRVEKPFELAQYLLKNDTTWTATKITEAMNLGTEKWVTLKQKVPVYIVYFTAWLDHQGTLQFRNDVYGHDAKMKGVLKL